MWMTVDEAAAQLRSAIDKEILQHLQGNHTMAKNVTRLFDKELLKQIMWDDTEDFEVLEDEITDTSRWSVHHYMVFKELSSGKCYGVGYSRGATECQDERPFEYAGPEIECDEVEPVEVKIIKFKPVLAE